jgi:Flp pilus assembly pilin Flp
MCPLQSTSRLSARLSGVLERVQGRAHQQRGASSVEYALLVAGIAAICVVVLGSLGVSVRDLLDALQF